MPFVMQSVHAASLRNRDVALCKVWKDEIQDFGEKLIKACGHPTGHNAIVFRCENEVYIRARKAYVEKCMMFYKGWIAAKPSSLCEQFLSTKNEA